MAWTVISAYVLDQIWAYQTANRLRTNLITLAARRSGRSLGGSRDIPNQVGAVPVGRWRAKIIGGLGPHDVYNAQDVEIDGTEQSGITYQAMLWVRTSHPGLSITPKIRNISAPADAGVGVACTATAPDYSGTNQIQTVTLTVTAAVHRYRLQYTLGSNGFWCDTWLTGEIQAFATA